jgi:DNA polymerase-3 subunit alpha
VSSSVSNKKTLEALACSGSFDSFNIKRENIFNECPEIIKHLKHFHDTNNSNQEDIFGEALKFEYKFSSKERWSEEMKLMKEFEILGFYLSGHPLNQFLNKVSKLDIKNFETIKLNKNFHNEKNVLLAGTLLSKKEKRSARGNAYAFLNFSDLSSIYELIIFENNLRKYRDILVEGDSYAIGIDFSDDGNGLRGEAKKIYKIVDVIKMNNQSYSSFSNQNNTSDTEIKKAKPKESLLQIYANEKFSLNEFKAINLQKGNHKINIIVENQRLALPDLYQINTNLIEKIRSINGVKEVSFDE